MRKQVYILSIVFLIYTVGFSQSGINTTTPTAELEIATTNTGIPALQLNPQTAPTGSETGQLAVIGDMLYMYDATRAKWLSVDAQCYQFGLESYQENIYLDYGGILNGSAGGPRMPRDGTIVYISLHHGNSSDYLNKDFDIRINGATQTTLTTSNTEYMSSSHNIDIDKGDYLGVFVHDDPDPARVRDPSACIWVRWRP